jgi:hypothetical protein
MAAVAEHTKRRVDDLARLDPAPSTGGLTSFITGTWNLIAAASGLDC